MFQDIGTGILLAIFTSYLFHTPLTVFLVVAAIIFSLLPDIDFIFPAQFVRGHRGIIHYPFIYAILGIFVYFIFGPMWAFIFITAVFCHFIHDTFFLGWGIKWSWPASLRSYKFFPDKKGKITSKLFLSWLPEGEAKIKSEYNSSHWIKTFFFTINIVSVSEYLIFIVSLVVLYFYIK